MLIPTLERRLVIAGLLKKGKVSTAPGIAFGSTGEAHLRIAYVPEEEANKAFDRMEVYFV